MTRWLFVFCITFVFSSTSCALTLQNTLFEKVGTEVGIDPLLLYSVALAESAYNPNNTDTISPHPWTLRTSVPIYLNSPEEAKARLVQEMQKTNLIDVGLMQINLKWHAHRVPDPLTLLDPETNLRVGAQILKEALLSSPHNLVTAIGRFHSYDPKLSRRYGLTVYWIYIDLMNQIEQ